MSRYGLVRGMLVLVAASGVLAASAGAADDKDAVGTWKLTFDPGNGERKPTLTVTKEGSGLKGKYEDKDSEGDFEVTDVKFKDGTLTFTTKTERDVEPATATFEGKVEGDSIEGDANRKYQGMSGTFPFKGKREAK